VVSWNACWVLYKVLELSEKAGRKCSHCAGTPRLTVRGVCITVIRLPFMCRVKLALSCISCASMFTYTCRIADPITEILSGAC
jgi:hypothetical protein